MECGCNEGRKHCEHCENGRVEQAVGERAYDCDCRDCGGRGWVWCDRCDGTGELDGDEASDAEHVQQELALRARAFAGEIVDALAALEADEGSVAA